MEFDVLTQYVKNLKGTSNLKDLGVDGKIILKMGLK
jgi:hypothetical protein